MYVFLDESFRDQHPTRRAFGVLAGVAISDRALDSVQSMIYAVRKPYHGRVLKESDEFKGNELLGTATWRSIRERGFSEQFNLVEEVLQRCAAASIVVVGVVCFEQNLHTFAANDPDRLSATFGSLLKRVDHLAKRSFPGERAQVVFDGRDHGTNSRNALAITNFLVKSPVGRTLDAIRQYPLFGVSQANNYALQIADLVTTVIALHHQQRPDARTEPLWRVVDRMVVRFREGTRRWSTLKVLSAPQ